MRTSGVVSRLAVIVGLGAFAACHSSTGAAGASSANGPVARFKLGAGDAAPAYLDVPFPSSAYLTPAGTVLEPLPGLDNVVPNGTKFITRGLGDVNGFSRVALASFVVDDPTQEKLSDGNAYAKIDRATLPVAEADCTTATSSVYLVDLAPAAGAPAILPCRAGFHDDTPRSSTPPTIAVGPARGAILDEGHDYAVVITSRVKDVSGKALAMSDDMRAVAAGTAPGETGALYNKAYASAQAALQPMLADGARIVALAPYKTQKMSQELFALRDALEAQPAATLAWDAATVAPMGAVKFAAPVGGKLPAGFTASLDDLLGVATQKLPSGVDDPSVDSSVRAHDKIAALGTAVFQATTFLPEKPSGNSDLGHHVFVRDGGTIVPQGQVKIWVSFAVPTAPMPASGYPTVILQHGLSGSRDYLLDLANVFAAQGWLVAAIDSVTFGARAPEAMFQVDSLNAWSKAPGAKYQGPDGLADPVNGTTSKPDLNGTTNGSFDCFGGLQNILAIRDQFRQAGYDTAQLVKVLRSNPDLSALDTGAGAPKIDGDRLVYVGDSLGAMEGTLAAAIEPSIKAWVLNVNGGSVFPELAMHSPTMGLQVAAAAGLNFDLSGDRLDLYHPFMSVLQDIFEAGDPITYAPYLVKSPQPLAGHVTPPRNVLQIEALFDELVPNEANEAIARAGGWGLATPNVGSNAEVYDFASVATNPRRTPLPDVSPDGAGAIHDTPSPGITAVVVQCSPCAHGQDLVNRNPTHDFTVPYFDPQGHPSYVHVSPGTSFAEPFLGIQSAMTTFLGDAIQGRVPRVMGFVPPVRDFDADTFIDDVDAFPNDPTKH